jgi:hypothetical protein
MLDIVPTKIGFGFIIEFLQPLRNITVGKYYQYGIVTKRIYFYKFI